ncbi:MAG: glycogen debranching protein [Armatimonadetes bacterium]|nr:glycogen debranching protein [Armatimonadota bacterium]
MTRVRFRAEVENDEALIEEAYERAKKVLDRCSTPGGFFASPDYYNAVYARDALIMSLGGLASGEERFVRQWTKSMNTLMDHQSPTGQIPNCVDMFVPSRPRIIAFGAADASLWFVLTLAYADRLFGPHPQFEYAASRAMFWLRYQDAHEEGLIEQQEATDWMDITANRGHVLYTNVLYFAALELRGDIKRAHLVREAVNGFLWSNELGYFRPWAWKQEHGDWFDSAANCFAIAFGLADAQQTERILDYIERNQVDRPYPIRAIHPPIQPGDKDWREYYVTEHELNMPNQYHNGGIWPWIGGLYVVALVRAGRMDRARENLVLLARANKLGRKWKIEAGERVGEKRETLAEWDFNEWLHGITGEPRGAHDQGWSAGMYIYAYTCVKQGCEPVFSCLESAEAQLLHNTGRDDPRPGFC